ncbi:phosphoethanolamine--lipid A transferase [Paucibacter sp. R3-3]|uniref:Phosphoethanolamine--lipid A transferase n=1 Tax=Roseateles agri TaxID=3098619 RepID=A0ABU5DLF0_9BURK|nr:phosphoethanolamine--lipid A transferase [Paucibacter sp. R3-3]MDY0747133.1 phosphoethanolamine--lipid A transferase [Paucibacter sp. R3-3]
MRLPPLKSPLTIAWLASLWMGLLCNWPLWQKLASLPELDNARGHLFIGVFCAFVVALQGGLLSLFAWRATIKPVLTVVLLAAAALAYFIGSYGIVMDPTMVINTLQTDARETRDLLNLRLAASLLVLAGLPLLVIWRLKLTQTLWPRRLGWNLIGFVGGIVVSALLILATFADFAATMRSYPTMRYMITPVNAFYSLAAVAARSGAKPKGPPQVIGADAKLASRPAGTKPPLLLLVVGETARAANFALDGYSRPTTPELAKLPVLNFSKATSCGTSTAASLPCMFSPLGREEFVKQKNDQETLMDVLQRAGLAVLWVDNQSGCKGICDRVPNSPTAKLPEGAPALPAGLCDGEECLDMSLLHGLDERLAALDPERAKRGVVLVLHQMGSHGPAYYKRSPPDRKPFMPECTTNALQQCPREQVVNGYDNSIAYTDHVLASAIGWLQGREKDFATRMYYVSDHGESLGENNLYLHGVPYAVAPEEQKHVPMVLWLGQDLAPVTDCLKAKLDQPASHDNLFHTVLGFMGVQTALYKPEQDLLASCTTKH